MKKILVLVAILAIGLGSINAQDNLRWGVTAGMNVSSLNVTGLDSRVGSMQALRLNWDCLSLRKVFIWISERCFR